MITIRDLLNDVHVMKTQAEALVAQAKAMETKLVALLEHSAAQPQPKTATPPDAAKCACPDNLRKNAATMGHPNRTICRMCNTEHDA